MKTSVLPKSWRFKWNLVRSLILDEGFYLSGFYEGLPREYANAIESILLQHGGGLTKVSLCMPAEVTSTLTSHEGLIWEGQHLARTFVLPNSIFSAVNLKSLEIQGYKFCPQTCFEGFPNLTRSSLIIANTTVDSLTHFVSMCPKLEKVALEIVQFDDGDPDDSIQPKLTHLRLLGDFLYFSLSDAQNP